MTYNSERDFNIGTYTSVNNKNVLVFARKMTNWYSGYLQIENDRVIATGFSSLHLSDLTAALKATYLSGGNNEGTLI